jgi:hypothetical protein
MTFLRTDSLPRLLGAIVVVAAFGSGCARRGPGPSVSPPIVTPPTIPTAIAGINTKWDDFNAAKPANSLGLVYSTNRGSEGHDLDVFAADVAWGPKPSATGEPVRFSPALMSSADERGPILLPAAQWTGGRPWEEVLLFASGREGGKGGLDLYWAGPCPGNQHDCPGAPQNLAELNSAANDAYLTLPFRGRRVLFASDRDGGYDIHEASWKDGAKYTDAPASVRKVAALSTDADDTAPYVAEFGDRIEVVFVSKRDGGSGGYDIWCSRLEGESWAAPVNLAAGINSPGDEFRPSVFRVENASFLVFSSNRPGGEGGFDLYTVSYPGCAPHGR